MKYITLRDCYVNDRLWRKGEVYELPDEMNKSEKNFKPLDEPAPAPVPDKTEPAPAPVPASALESEPEPEPTPETLKCPSCGKECKSVFGLRAHMKIHK